jgi:hypothetical protein
VNPGSVLTNPFSSGGGGNNFENSVQALFTVLLLTGGFAPCLSPVPIKRIILQGKYAGYETDDCVICLEGRSAREEPKLLTQIKHKVSITEKDSVFADAVGAAWRDFNNGTLFVRDRDALALITGPLSATDIDRDEYKDFVSGFIWARLRSKGWNWPNTLGIEHWTTEQQLGFLLKLPFAKEAWELAGSLLKEHLNRYWAAVFPNAYNVAEKDLIEATKLLLSYGRPRGAIQCLARLAFQKKEIDPSLVCRALLDAASVDDKSSPLDQHAARQLIKWLQDNASTSADELFKVEWAYLRLLDKSYGGVGAKTLEGRLARDPVLMSCDRGLPSNFSTCAALMGLRMVQRRRRSQRDCARRPTPWRMLRITDSLQHYVT